MPCSKLSIIIIIIKACRRHELPWLTLSLTRHLSVSVFQNLIDSTQCSHRADKCEFLLVCLFVGVHRRTLLMSLSLFLQSCTVCLARHSNLIDTSRDQASNTPVLNSILTWCPTSMIWYCTKFNKSLLVSSPVEISRMDHYYWALSRRPRMRRLHPQQSGKTPTQ